MKVNYDDYCTALFASVAFLVSMSITVFIAILINKPQVLFAFIICALVSLMFGAIGSCNPSRAPDNVHMDKKNEYIIFGDCKYVGNTVYVKMFPGVWVKTEREAKDMEDFINQKVEYQHKMKDTFKV